MGDQMIVNVVFVDGAGRLIEPDNVGSTFRVTHTEAVYVSREDAEQEWVLRHYVVWEKN